MSEEGSPATRPRVSIVVPTLTATPLLFDCLSSIRSGTSREIGSETIVVVNGGGAAAAERISTAAPWARVFAPGANLGFGGGCNLGARSSRGDFLVFLNDDAEVAPGWLEALVQAAERNPTAGAVGSLVLFPDGSIQEAGSIVWRDGSTLGIGRGLPLEEGIFQEVRRVDYCSACSLLVRRAAWEAAGGFDTRYYPAYYEDVDLCFTLRRLGWSVLLQPRSRVRHHEAASSDSRKRLFLVLRHRKLFVEKWRTELERHEAPQPESPRAVGRAMRLARRAARQILLIDDRPPNRAIGSGFALLLEAIRDLSHAGYSLSFVASDRHEDDFALLRDLGVEVLDEPPERALARTDRSYCTVIVSRPHNFGRFGPLVRGVQPHAALVYVAEALFHRRMERAAALLEDPGARRTALSGAMEMRELERRIVREADYAVSVSSIEADWMSRQDGACPVETILPTAWGIDVTSPTFSDRRGLLFVPGWLAGESSPNVDALSWFAREVLPRIARRIPWIRVDVTGGDPPSSIRALARGSLRLLGRVDDLAGAYASARVVVVPVRIGSGVKIKTIEAIQHGVPVVTTEVGAEGLPADGASAIVVADDAAKFAAAVVELYTREEAWRQRRHASATLALRWRSEARPSWSPVLRRARLKGSSAVKTALVV